MQKIACGCAVLMLSTFLLIGGERWARSSLSVLASSFPVITAANLPRLQADHPLTFTSESSFVALLEGWGKREPWGVWSEGDVGTLGFRLAITEPLTPTSTLVLEVQSYGGSSALMRQRVQVSIDNVPVGAFILLGSTPVTSVKVPFADPALKLDDVVVVKFFYPDAPSEIIPDDRMPAMGILSVALVP